MKGLEEETKIDQMTAPGDARGGGLPAPAVASSQQSQNPNLPNSKRDVIDSLCTSVNQDLLISKTFYFFFFSAFGSLFPLLAVYFKQMGMNPGQSGLLIGIRPFVEFLAAPFWGSMADRFRKGKIMLIFSLVSWIVFTLALAFIQPPAFNCGTFNVTQNDVNFPQNERDKRSVSEGIRPPEKQNDLKGPKFNLVEDLDLGTKGDTAFGRGLLWNFRKRDDEGDQSDEEEDKPTSKKKTDEEEKPRSSGEYNPTAAYISPPFSSIVYKWEDVQETFFLLLLLIVLGEFFSAPAITLADSATLSYLAENTDNYGRQRMFGSLGWGLAMFFVGIALDHSTVFPDHPCMPHVRERNYTICFATFSVLMGCALIAATQFRFDYDNMDEDSIPMKAVQNGPTQMSNNNRLPSFLTEGTVIDDTPCPLPPPPAPEPIPKSTVFAQTTKKLPEWLTVLRTFANLRYGAFLYVTWFMGFGIGLVFTFLFWHLQDLGGTPTLFGVASVINHISEIFAYFFSFKFIRQIGHTKVLCIGLVGNIGRFLYISWLHDPWWVLPFEFVQGITHAAVWAACCSYITQATPANLRSSAQGVLQGLHHGLGRGCGAVIGGIFVNYFGTQVTFRGYGFACLIVLILFVFINYYRRDKGFSSFHDEQEPETVVEETAHLAPHGVPSNPMARSLSKQNLGESRGGAANNNNDGGYGTNNYTPNTTGGYLGVPGAGNGSNYSADYNMNTMSNGGYALTRRALAAAFNPKGILASAASPEAAFEYDFIRRDFQAYNEVTMLASKADSVVSKCDRLMGPSPKTTLFSPQPKSRNEADYEW